MNTLFAHEKEPSEDENLNHLTATGILPGFDGGDTCGETRGSVQRNKANKSDALEEAYQSLIKEYFSDTIALLMRSIMKKIFSVAFVCQGLYFKLFLEWLKVKEYSNGYLISQKIRVCIH